MEYSVENLRQLLEDLVARFHLRSHAIVEAMEEHNAKHKTGYLVMDRTTIDRFRDSGASKSPDKLIALWTFLHRGPYAELVSLVTQPKPSPLDDMPPDIMLSAALLRFVRRERAVSPEFLQAMQARYPGKYVMYRADLRPFKLNVETPHRFRASNVEITCIDGHLLITELQDFPATEWDEPFYIQTSGVMFPYGRYIMCIMQAVVRESMRLLVIAREFSFTNDYAVSHFNGTILVASSEDMFPSTRFFCLRDDGTLKTGLLPLENIPHTEARAYLRDAHTKAAFHYT